MARRTVYVPLICLLLGLGAVWHLPRVAGNMFSDAPAISQKQVVFYLVALKNDTTLTVNCSTYFNSSIKAYLLTQRPVDDAVNPAFVNSSDTDDNQNHTTLSITTNETKVYYIQINQLDDKADFLLVNATISPDQEGFALTRYYIPFIGGYPVLEFISAIIAGLFVLQKIVKRGHQNKR